jgi:hypothetical protein
MTTPTSTYNPPKFAVGNLIHFKQTNKAEYDKTQIFRIDKLREDRGGSYHDGQTDTTVATITNTKTNETFADVTLVYDNFMCRYYYAWAVLVESSI